MDHAALLDLGAGRVEPGWIDYNGHMNVAYYVVAFDLGTDRFLDDLGIDAAYRNASACTTYALEARVHYLRELKVQAPYRLALQLLDYDSKRIHFFQTMTHADDGYLAATYETLSMHIDSRGPRGVAMPGAVLSRLEALARDQAGLPRPPQTTTLMGIRRRA